MDSKTERYILLFGGIISLVFGILLFTQTTATLALIMLLVGLSWFIQGIVTKSANHFRAWWANVASLIIDCDPPGIASNDLFTFRFEKKTDKLYPLDKDAVYSRI